MSNIRTVVEANLNTSSSLLRSGIWSSVNQNTCNAHKIRAGGGEGIATGVAVVRVMSYLVQVKSRAFATLQ